MKALSVSTTQNVSIEYGIATITDRFLAWLIDAIIIVVSIALFGFYAAANVYDDNLWVFVVVNLILFFYTPVMEILNNGQTVGKMALGTRVLTIHGDSPDVVDYLIRWSFRLVDIYLSAGGFAAALVMSGSKGQRLGGVLSNTTIVKLSPRRRFTLRSLDEITGAADYETRYPNIRKCSEKDMLTIKNVITRYERIRNRAHAEAVTRASVRMQEILGEDKGKENDLQFLKVLLKDYVVLTR